MVSEALIGGSNSKRNLMKDVMGLNATRDSHTVSSTFNDCGLVAAALYYTRRFRT